MGRDCDMIGAPPARQPRPRCCERYGDGGECGSARERKNRLASGWLFDIVKDEPGRRTGGQALLCGQLSRAPPVRVPAQPLARRLHPRHSCRGFIEARPCCRNRRAPRAYIRGTHAAASLKLDGADFCHHVGDDIRSIRAAASLKRDLLCRLAICAPYIRGIRAACLIEANAPRGSVPS